jgi:hypothetical protein
MKILLFKKTKDSDLRVGLQVCYKSINGNYGMLGVITDILETKPLKEYILNTSFGSYTADELKLIKE